MAENEERHKKIMLNSTKKNVGRRSEPACWTYGYVPFYLIVHGIEVLSYMMHEYHEDEEQYQVILKCNFFVFQNANKIIMYSVIKWILPPFQNTFHRLLEYNFFYLKI
jgi:hypothetical protein